MKQIGTLRKLLLVYCVFFAAIAATAQRTITGIVTDQSDGSPLPGVTIVVKGAAGIGTITDFDGKYTIEIPSVGTALTFSFVGYKPKEMALTSDLINVQLEIETKGLEEVVVVGYGVQKKRDVAGAISKVSSKDITDVPSPSFEAALQGKAAGVQVIQGSGIAGSASVVRVRGTGSISAAGDPLYVIDGVPVSQDYFLRGNSGGMNNNPLASLNPDDIESVEILKDAGSAGIYGSRGANGVILITTKRGKKGKATLSFSSKVGVSRPAITPEFVSRDEWLQLRQEAWENDGGTGPAWLPNYSSPEDPIEVRAAAWEKAKLNDTDWWDEVTQTGFKQEYNLAGTLGTEKFNNYLGFSYSDNSSYLKGNSYERLSGRYNLDANFNKYFKFTLSSSLSQGLNNKVGSAWDGGTGSAMSTALPIYPLKNADGTWFKYNSSANGGNPVMKQELLKWRSSELRFINNASINIMPTENLTFTANGGADYMELNEEKYQPKEYLGSEHIGQAESWPVYVTNYTGNLLVNYSLDIASDKRLTFLGGTEAQQSKTESNYKRYENIEGPLYEDPNLDEAEQKNADFNKPSKWTFISYFSRINFVLKEKYIFQVLARVDGSSKFGKNNRYGFFPAGSFAWRISDENFLKGNSVVSNLKLRTSYGITGNASIPNYEWIGTYKPIELPGYNGNGIIYPLRLENPDLKWETLHNFDVALEYGFFNDRISGEIAFYNKISKDVLINRQNPPSQGFGNYWDNVGEILNRGYELNITTRNLIGDFKWTTNLNVARNYNEVLDIGDLTPDAVGGGTNDTRIVVGKPVGTNYLVRFSRIDPADGLPIWLDKNGYETKVFSLDNRVVVGSVVPDATGGITNTFEYKGFELSCLFSFTLGGNLYDGSGKRQLGIFTDWNYRKEIGDHWREPGDIAEYPKLTLKPGNYPGLPGEWQYNSTMFLYDASFLRLRNITLSYNLPKSALSRMHMANARVFVSATNLLTWSYYPWDPEIARDFENAADRNMSPNITYLTPPQEQAFTFGLNFSF